MKVRQSRKAFTLVELLIVISIIAVLAGLVIPNLAPIMRVGPKMKSMNAARSIATTWGSYVRGEKTRVVRGADIYEWIFNLASKAELNNPKMFILEFDPKFLEKGAPMPTNIAIKTGIGYTPAEEFKAFPISWEIANAVMPSAGAETPLLWTRGLKPTGTWDRNEDVFEGDGGHIAFAGGTVTYFNTLRPEEKPSGELKRYDNDTMPTFDISAAVKGGAKNILRSYSE